MKSKLVGALLVCLGAIAPDAAWAVACPGEGPNNVTIESQPGLAGGVRPVWSDNGPVVRVDPTAGGYKPELFARQIHQFLLMHGLAHFCKGHVTSAQRERFANDPDYTGWASPGAELAADCWAARQLASRGSTHIAQAAALMFDAGDGVFTGRSDNPAHAQRARRIRRCANIE